MKKIISLLIVVGTISGAGQLAWAAPTVPPGDFREGVWEGEGYIRNYGDRPYPVSSSFTPYDDGFIARFTLFDLDFFSYWSWQEDPSDPRKLTGVTTTDGVQSPVTGYCTDYSCTTTYRTGGFRNEAHLTFLDHRNFHWSGFTLDTNGFIIAQFEITMRRVD